MDYRYLGRTGLKISALGMGTMTFGGDADEAESRVLFQRCREAGINFFDCANVYAGGRSEEILGRLIADCRQDVVLSSKGGFPTSPDVNARGSSRYNLTNAVEASLRRLRTDRIDLYFLHGFDPDTALDETLRALEDLVREGKVVHTAVSNFAAWQTMKALGLQERHGWSPLAAGLLTGKYGRDRRPDTGRLTSNKMYQARYGEDAYIDVAEAFVALARERAHSPAALAIAWVASHPAVTAPVLGARSLKQLEDCLGAADIKMTPELRDSVSALSAAPPPATDRNEETGPHRHAVR